MAKDDLNSIYDKILGQGEPLVEDESSDGNAVGDGAYGQEDYDDEAGDGEDPRETEDYDLGFEEEDDLGDDASDEDDESGADGDGDGAGEDEEEEIPQRLVEAGRLANLSDDAIIELSETRPEALEALARAQEMAQAGTQRQTANQDAGQQEKEKSSVGFKPLELELTGDDEEEMGSKAVSMIKQLTETVNKLGGKLEQQESSLGNVQKQTEQERIRQIDTHFDSLSDEIPSLGTTASLTKEQVQNRVFVVNTAAQAMRVYGVSDKEALAMGVKALTGQQSEASIKNKLVRDLDKNKKRFTARGRSRQKPGKKTSTKDRAMQAINDILDSDEY